MGVRFSSSCVFVFYIVFSFSFCLLKMFVIWGNFLIEKKKIYIYIFFFLKLHICVYLRNKFQVSNIILTSLDRAGSPPPQNKPLKSPPRLGLNFASYFSLKMF